MAARPARVTMIWDVSISLTFHCSGCERRRAPADHDPGAARPPARRSTTMTRRLENESDAGRVRPPAAGYSGTPLPKKLGINPDSSVGLVDAPEDFATTLGELPPGASL